MLHVLALIGLAAGCFAGSLVASLLLFVGFDTSVELIRDLAAKRHYARKEG